MGLRPRSRFFERSLPSGLLPVQINVWDMLVVCVSVYMGPSFEHCRHFQRFRFECQYLKRGKKRICLNPMLANKLLFCAYRPALWQRLGQWTRGFLGTQQAWTLPLLKKISSRRSPSSTTRPLRGARSSSRNTWPRSSLAPRTTPLTVRPSGTSDQSSDKIELMCAIASLKAKSTPPRCPPA